MKTFLLDVFCETSGSAGTHQSVCHITRRKSAGSHAFCFDVSSGQNFLDKMIAYRIVHVVSKINWNVYQHNGLVINNDLRGRGVLI